jgi:ABC-type multidrug transport system ATPase subunit
MLFKKKVKDAKMKGNGNPTVLSAAANASKMAVRCFAPPPPTIPVLNNLSGSLRPATLILILGELGSGKSVFIEALAGRIPKYSGLQVPGDITYNGVSLDEFDTGRVINLMLQRDLHIGSLTVQETTEFAAQCQLGDDERGQALEELPSEENVIDSKVIRRLRPQLVLSLISLDGVTNVIVGDNATRGISGGQRRRVSLAEALAGSRRIRPAAVVAAWR